MGTAWPQKYHSSRGHASAATVLALNKTASSPVAVVASHLPTLQTLALTPPPPVSRFRTEDDEPTVTTADAESATATTATTVPSVGPAGGRERRRWWCRSAGNDRYPVPAAVPVAAGLWQLSPWRPTGAGEDLDDRGSIKAVAATPKSATAPTSTATTTKTTTTTMNASNHVTLNRFVRLTITLLITRTLMLRLVQLQMLLASVVVVLAATNSTVNRADDDDDNNNNKQPPHQQQQQPNAAIQQPTNNNHNCTVSRRRRSAPTTKTKGTGQQQRHPSGDCWPPSLYCYPVPAAAAVVAILRIVGAKESVKVTAVVRIDAVTREKERGVLKARREGQHDHRALGCSEWCGCFCRHCSSLTCSRFFTERPPSL